MKVRRGAVAGIAIGVLLVAAAITFPILARRLSFFRVRQVEVVGNRYLDEADVVRRLGLRRDASTFDRLEPVRKAAAAIPGVLAAEVERRLVGSPGTELEFAL